MTPRERAISWAQETAANPAAVVLDLETTGLGPEAEICDIAIVAIDGRVLLDSLVLPLNPIPPESTAVHGITKGMLDRAKAPMWGELWPRVATILHPGRTIVVYNAQYDQGIINQVNRAANLAEFAAPWQCAMKAYSEYNGTVNTLRRPRHGPAQPGWSWKWWKLGEAASALGIENPGAHRALADAQTTRRLVLAMAGYAPEAIVAESGQLALFDEMTTGAATTAAARWRD